MCNQAPETPPSRTSQTELYDRVLSDLFTLMGLLRRRSPWLDVDLTTAQLKTLMAICCSRNVHGRLLAQVLGVGQPTVSKLVDHLVERGYVVREEDQHDRRVVWLRPSPSGWELFHRLVSPGRDALRSVLASLEPEELKTVARACDLLARAAERLTGNQSSTGSTES